jgi:DNA polymerase-1
MKVENPLIPVLVAMERTGLEMDIDYAKEYGKQLEIEIDELKVKLAYFYGSINFNSSHQLKPVLEKIVGKKLESTDAKKVLKPLASDFEAIRVLLEYKDLVKLHSTYIDALPDKRKKDGRIHGSFGQINTLTPQSRWS